ncbi:MAG: UDP-N-acetylmuramoyl-L-alanine--D-glutamate ligase [Acidimicrobiaceae bacterium]|nr:UDP-N-acetylmuramoyl-L-alanine--D-glutamate ligase [Acidimicrobiaceae bacterium]
MSITLVYGLAIAGQAVARALFARGENIILADDSVSDAHQSLARELGAQFVGSLETTELREIVKGVDRVVPAPGLPETHRVITVARQQNKPIFSEIELAYQFEQLKSKPREMVAVTGTDGKTTTTLMATEILNTAGFRSMAVGNTETPLIAALDSDAQVFAVECSSFRLAYTQSFRTKASVWLNLAPDHLDWHVSMDSYTSAKAQIWAHALDSDVAVVPFGNELIGEIAHRSLARVVSFGQQSGDYHARDGVLTTPDGPIMNAREMRRSLPHDLTNALAAAAITIESGLATRQDVAKALANFVNAPHRIELVAQANGVSWYNDSKATSPHAANVALRSFDSIVLIAGGKNKGLDLNEMASQPGRMRAVVAIGNSATEIERAFFDICEVRRAESMHDAVATANDLAKTGDVVLLSPGCTSYDWYANYAERGQDFSREVNALINISKTTSKGDKS